MTNKPTAVVRTSEQRLADLEQQMRAIVREEIPVVIGAMLVELELLARRAAQLSTDATELEDAIGGLLSRLRPAGETPGDFHERIHLAADLKETGA